MTVLPPIHPTGWAPTVGRLQRRRGVDGSSSVVGGRLEAGDGAGGHFWWDATCELDEDGGTVFLGAGRADTGRWRRLVAAHEPIDVRWFGAVGDDSTDDQDALELAHAAATAQGRKLMYSARPGQASTVYRHSARLDHPGSLLEVEMAPGVETRFTGTGVCWQMGAEGAPVVGAVLRGRVVGNANATVGVRAVRSSWHRVDVLIRDAKDFGYKQEGGVQNRAVVSVDVNQGAFVTQPDVGVYVGDYAGVEATTTVLDVSVAGLQGKVGVKLDKAIGCTLTGVIQGMNTGGTGLVITALGGNHTIRDLWMEVNLLADILCAGYYCTFDRVRCTNLVRFEAGIDPPATSAYGNVLRGGAYGDVENASPYQQRWDGPALYGSLTDPMSSPGFYWDHDSAQWVTT